MTDLREVEGDNRVERTLNAMISGAEIIVQAALKHKHWGGFADILYRVPKKSDLGNWSYEVGDTKLAQNTKAGTVLQLCVYSDLVCQIQGIEPEHFYVIKPGHEIREIFRVKDFSAYYRHMRKQLEETLTIEISETYPDPVSHCDICHWWAQCNLQRRNDDHLSFVAGMHSHHMEELGAQKIYTLGHFAKRKVSLEDRPKKGSNETYRKLHEQARIQYEGRLEKTHKYNLRELGEGEGFHRLPEPSQGDVYFDIEGDRFYREGGLEYLLGVAWYENDEWQYKGWWSFNRKQEKQAFEQLMDFFMTRWKAFPDFNIYHFAPYEPSALKHLMLRHATKMEQLDQLLRAERLIDLHSILKQSLIASVEQYGLKDLEPFYKFERKIELPKAQQALYQIQRALELELWEGIVDEKKDLIKKTIKGYNKDDCISTRALQQLLEHRRGEYEREFGPCERPTLKEGNPSDNIDEINQRIDRLFQFLTKDLPDEQEDYNEEQKALWLLAHLLGYFQRENKNFWWEYFNRREMDFEDLLEDRKAIAGLKFIESIPKVGRERSEKHRYRFPTQEISLSVGAKLEDLNNEEGQSSSVGTVFAIDLAGCLIDIKKSRHYSKLHPQNVQVYDFVKSNSIENALFEFAEDIIGHSLDSRGDLRCGRDLLLKLAPAMNENNAKLRLEGELVLHAAKRIARQLQNSVLPIQGPPGSGKTFTGAHIILDLLKSGKKIGVSAVSHKAIDNLLEKVYQIASKTNQNVPLFHVGKQPEDDLENIIEYGDKKKAVRSVEDGKVVGATAFHWSSPEVIDSLDYLIIDEAGQMSLAYVLAISRSSKNLIMLGDPQQLEQPQKEYSPRPSSSN